MHKTHELPRAFSELGIQAELLRALGKMGFHEPSEIQKEMIPLVLQGRDVIGQARTGTGKTAAFGLPILQMIEGSGGLQALVLVPTRELAVQVAAEFIRFAEYTGLHVVPIYGGQRIKYQAHLLGKKPHVVIGTPGRIIDMLERRLLNFDHVRFVVLDEVDRMLDIGFRDDIRLILSKVTSPHQTVFTSATMTGDIKRLVMRYTDDPIEVNVSQDELTVEEVTQTYITVDPWDKFEALRLLLKNEKPPLTIIFCNTKHTTRRLAKRLHGEGIEVKEIHGDLVQQKRERVMEHFRKHKVRVLVATDLAARGIDVQGISHIVNYDIPEDSHVYVHRIGRTARMGSFGKAISFVTREQGAQLTEIEVLINKQILQDCIEGFQPRPEGELRHGGDGPGPRRETAATAPASAGISAPVETGAETAPARRGIGARRRPSRRRRGL